MDANEQVLAKCFWRKILCFWAHIYPAVGLPQETKQLLGRWLAALAHCACAPSLWGVFRVRAETWLEMHHPKCYDVFLDFNCIFFKMGLS